MVSENTLEWIDEFTAKLPDGAYFDNEEMLHTKDGDLLPDGLYQLPNGELLSYEGNFLNMPLE